MKRTYKVIYKNANGREKYEILEASSKYDAKKRFYQKYPKCDIVKVDELEED